MRTLRSIWTWFISITLILLWLPTLALLWLLDRDPVKYRTGWWFRTLGTTLVRVNPAWRLNVQSVKIENPRNPYVVVSNHQSMADIPIVSHVPWEMKWVAKEELFRMPIVGWMLRMARDIPVDRKDRRSGAKALAKVLDNLRQHVSVMFFPEGTRSLDGRVGRFNDGPFSLAIKAGVPIIPIAVEGSSDCLPKNTWKFGDPRDIYMTVLRPVDTSGYNKTQVAELRDHVRSLIVAEVARIRGAAPEAVDALSGTRAFVDEGKVQ